MNIEKIDDHEIVYLFNNRWMDGRLTIGLCLTHSEVTYHFQSHDFKFGNSYTVEVMAGKNLLDAIEELVEKTMEVIQQHYEAASAQHWKDYKAGRFDDYRPTIQ